MRGASECEGVGSGVDIHSDSSDAKEGCDRRSARLRLFHTYGLQESKHPPPWAFRIPK